MKMHYNQGKRPQIYYWRDSNQNEVDLLIQDGMNLKAVEIKAGKTINSDFLKVSNTSKKSSPMHKAFWCMVGPNLRTKQMPRCMP
ncbi:uncharacterized protein DUF4143 [Dyadobacter jejuensis]|uniref:Uncharacterized protein DUF4143 n=2 Tax=Dyadobacter jejuensis TaxID=1082580 RepID=A0A316AJA0_9BACT|nr:uncharacterized protein DUF4143 [Dyadobacter jejuensis]